MYNVYERIQMSIEPFQWNCQDRAATQLCGVGFQPGSTGLKSFFFFDGGIYRGIRSTSQEWFVQHVDGRLPTSWESLRR